MTNAMRNCSSRPWFASVSHVSSAANSFFVWCIFSNFSVKSAQNSLCVFTQNCVGVRGVYLFSLRKSQLRRYLETNLSRFCHF
jgi:hypothetical protein